MHRELQKRVCDVNQTYRKRASYGLALVILNSFLVQYYVSVLGSYVLYFFAIGVSTIVLSLAKPRRAVWSFRPNVFWILALSVIVINLARLSFDINTFADLVTFSAGVIMVACSGEDVSLYRKSFHVIVFMAIYYAVTVWIQILFTSFSDVFFSLLSEHNQDIIMRGQQSKSVYTGFSSNVAYTAGHIVVGILVLLLVFRSNRNNRNNWMTWFGIAFLVTTLLVTGKRSSIAFAIISVSIVYVFAAKGWQRKLYRISVIMSVIVALIIVVYAFYDVLQSIPGISRIVNSVIGYTSGKDISSNRISIYSYAWELFIKNPVVGIGWGNFRNMTIGNITQAHTVEVHNIYLQLLCETGILGFIVVVFPMILFLIASFSAVGKVKEVNSTSSDITLNKAVRFSLAYQIYFLLYGLLENPLYDHNFLIMYMFSCAIYVTCWRKNNAKAAVRFKEKLFLWKNGQT